MTPDELKTLTTNALDQLATALDSGHSQALAAMLTAMSRFHQYSFHNICLIASQRPNATRVAGFQAWKSLGRFVRRGEKGIAILAPIVRRRTDAAAEDEERAIVGFRAAYVFDVAQTDGEPLPEINQANGDPGALLTQLRDAIQAAGIRLEYVADLDGALGASSGGTIQVVQGLVPVTEFIVLAHEHAHELLHHADDRPQSRDTRELEAEAVAFVVGQTLGLDVLDTARDYIHLYRGDREALAGSLERIQRTAVTILKAVSGP